MASPPATVGPNVIATIVHIVVGRPRPVIARTTAYENIRAMRKNAKEVNAQLFLAENDPTRMPCARSWT
jgi:hypothetical protein